MALTFASEISIGVAAGWGNPGCCWASGFGAAGMFLIVGNRTAGTQRVLTSEDAVVFTFRDAATASIWRDRAVSVGSGVAMFSDNGTAWTSAGTLPEANSWNAVCWDARTARFVAVAGTGANRVMTSVDGTTWVAVAAASALSWASVKASASGIVAVAAESGSTSNQLLMRSTDGAAATWALVTTPSAYLTGNDINNAYSSFIGYSDTLNVLTVPVNTNVGGIGRLIISSDDDGATWTEHTIPTPEDGKQVWGGQWIGEQFFVSRFSDFKYLTSPDGETWSQTAQSAPPVSSGYNAWAWSPTLRKFISAERSGSNTILVGTAPGVAQSIAPVVGSKNGGTVTTITGVGLSGVTSVTFGGTAAVSVNVVNDTTVTCITPAHAVGVVDVVVGGAGTLSGAFTFVSVDRVTPSRGSVAGSTAVTVTGFGFAAATSVLFGGVAATSVVVVSNTSITAVTPAHASGSVDVEVVGVDTGLVLYRYTLSVPQTLGKGLLLPKIPTRHR